MEQKHTIQTINIRTHDSSYGGFPYVCDVVVRIDAKVWAKLRKNDGLCMLYGVDISNEVSKRTSGAVPAWNPTVNDRDRAKDGIKTIFLEYYFRDHDAAERLGMKILRMRNGECIPDFGTVAFVYDSRKSTASLSLVGQG